MPRPLRCLEGDPVRNEPTGFPLFFDHRQQKVVTADPWALMRNLATYIPPKRQSEQAVEFITQAQEFFEAGATLHFSSRPLLYYYSFLNLVKAVMLIRGGTLPDRVQHGITDPPSNFRRRFRFEGQRVQIEDFARSHAHIFPSFMQFLGDTRRYRFTFLVLDLLKQVPSVHRTLIGVTGERENHIPVKFRVMYRRRHGVWVRAMFERGDRDVEVTLPHLRKMRRFTRVFTRKELAGNDTFHVFESEPIRAVTNAVDSAIGRLAKRALTTSVSAVLTNEGYRYYLSTTPPRESLNGIAASLAIFFYLSSITRYRPDVYGKLVGEDWEWLIGEFLTTQPLQMLYQLTSLAAGVDVVRPFAIV